MKGRFGDFGIPKSFKIGKFEATLVEFRGEKVLLGLYHTSTIRTIDFNLTLMFM